MLHITVSTLFEVCAPTDGSGGRKDFMKVLEDVGQKIGEHTIKNKYFASNSIQVERVPLPVGDYIFSNERVADVIDRKSKRGIPLKKMDFVGTYDISVDSKRDIEEVVGNICGKAHGRFRDECILAKNNGIKLYVLVENEDGITDINSLFRWSNPRMERYNKIVYMHSIGKWFNVKLPKAKPTTGETLAKAMLTMQLKYGVEFRFCKRSEAGKRVIELLEHKEGIQ